MRGIVFANGTIDPNGNLGRDIRPDDLVVCADGGVRNAVLSGVRPSVVIGDLDSAPSDLVRSLRDSGVRFIQHPTHKEETDAELALRYCVEQGVSEILFYGALGGRLDHALANLLLLAAPEFRATPITVVDADVTVRLCRDRCRIPGRPGDIVSLLPLGGDAHGVVTRGLEYPLKQETLKFGPARGISNVMLEESAEVQIAAGTLAVFHITNQSQERG